MSKGQLAPVNTQQLVGFFTEEELTTIKNSYAPNATNEEFALFIQICKHNSLTPFKNHIHFIKYGNQMSIQISVEGILHLAQQREDYKGVTNQLVHENDEFQVDLDPETQELKITKHSVKFPRGKVVASYAVARREGHPDKVVLIETDEIEHLKTKAGSQWKAYFNDMFKKHSLKRALKLQFGIDAGEEENAPSSFDNAPSYEPSRERRDITPQQKVIQTNDVEVIDEETEKQKLWEAIHNKLNSYAMSKGDLTTIIKEQFNKKPADLSLQQITGLSQLIDLKGREQSISTPFGDIEDKGLEFDFDK